MRRPTLLTTTLSTLLATVAITTAIGCNATPAEQPLASEPEPATAPAPAIDPIPEPAHELLVDARAPATKDSFVDDRPVLANGIATPATVPAPPVGKADRAQALRSSALLPAGTPERNAAAFVALPVTTRDQAPVAGVGASGIHLDELAVGKGWEASRCQDPSNHFVAGVDDRVNLCFRVVHPRVAETVTVEWSRAGSVRQRIAVQVRPTHGYLTRAWLPVRAGRAGEWTATVKSEDGSILGQRSFEIAAP